MITEQDPKPETRPCTRCGQPVDLLRGSWQTGPTSREVQHTTCPTSPELAALPIETNPKDTLPADTRPAAPAAPVPAYMTRAEAAELLRVHINTISNKIKDGELPALRVKGGRSLLLDRRDVLALLEPVEVGA